MSLVLTSRGTRDTQPQGNARLDPVSEFTHALLAGVNVDSGLLGWSGGWINNAGGVANIVNLASAQIQATGIPKTTSWSIVFAGAIASKQNLYPYFLGATGAGTAFALALHHRSFSDRVAFYDGATLRDSGISVALGEYATIGLAFDATAGTLTWAKNGVYAATNTGVGNVGGTAWQYAAPGGPEGSTTHINLLAFAQKALTPEQLRIATANPWQLFKKQERSIIIDLGAGGGGTGLSFEPATFNMNATAFNTSLSAQLGSTSFLLSGGELSSEAAASLEVDNTSVNLTGGSFTPNQTLSVGSSTFNQTPRDIDFLTNVNPDIGSTNFNFDATFLVLPFVLSISDALNGIIYTKLQENGYKGTLNEMLHSFFGGVGSLQDRERAWLILQTGADQGTNQDLWNTYLESFGYTGSLPDMLKEFWINY